MIVRDRLTPPTVAGLVPAAGAALLLLAGLAVALPSGPGAGPASGPTSGPTSGTVSTEVTAAAYTVPTARSASAARQAPERWLTIEERRRGYLVTAGLQDSRLRITRVSSGLKLVDPGTAELRSRPRSCRRIEVRVGVGAVCSVPARYTKRSPMKLGVVPRLGNDLVDASSLSARFDLSVLADAGHDVVRLGAGDDFVNGYKGVDRVFGGAGQDWIRTGIGNDLLKGGPGRDRLVGVEDDDEVRGGEGDDELGGGPGRDRLYGGPGRDSLSCGDGRDSAYADRSDTPRDCERVHR